jgi:hypothetical protein
LAALPLVVDPNFTQTLIVHLREKAGEGEPYVG